MKLTILQWKKRRQIWASKGSKHRFKLGCGVTATGYVVPLPLPRKEYKARKRKLKTRARDPQLWAKHRGPVPDTGRITCTGTSWLLLYTLIWREGHHLQTRNSKKHSHISSFHSATEIRSEPGTRCQVEGGELGHGGPCPSESSHSNRKRHSQAHTHQVQVSKQSNCKLC